MALLKSTIQIFKPIRVSNEMVEYVLPLPKKAALDFAYEENESQMEKYIFGGHPVGLQCTYMNTL